MICEDCGDECHRRKRCPNCGQLVCSWCWHHIHSLNLSAKNPPNKAINPTPDAAMFSSPLIEVSTIELLRLWGELVEAYHGVNGFGGRVAEIYAYRFQRYSPMAHVQPITKTGEEELHIISMRAGNALVALVEEFCNQYNCEATIDEIEPEVWCRQLNFGLFEFNHRVHVAIKQAA